MAEGLYRFEPAPLADARIVAAAHDPDYVAAFLSGSLSPAEMRRIGFPWSQGLIDRTLASAGGTHDAFRNEGSGYCVFNDVAIAIHALRAGDSGLPRASRFAVVDLDVHQGDGTAAFFAGDPGVLTLSFHGARNFPFLQQRSSIDVEFEDGAGDATYLKALDAALPRVAAFEPELVFYLSGVDALATDALGRLALRPAGLAERDRRVLEMCRTRGLPVVVTLGGGYSNPIEATVEAHANTFRIAARVFPAATFPAASTLPSASI